ncbi:hypothetical protein CLU79DRAFT_693923 [Phycomyces nitens]|nr:hypothetical protein CLU79DRAFT_693923 [Phycomyces nitens]
MQEREFQNMFTFSPGFEAASLKWHCKEGEDDGLTASLLAATGKKQMIGFARFRTRFEALEAVDVLTGKRIDQDKGHILKAEMAKKNLHLKRASLAPGLIDTNWKKADCDVFLPLPSDLLSPSSDYKKDPFLADLSTTPSPVFRGNPADQNPPCNTLYVGNLPPSTSEEELRQMFSQSQGYKRMCFRNKPQGPMCFVEFDDVVYATQALADLQGQSLSNSVKGGIRLSFSKNPLFTKPNKDLPTLFHKQLRMPVLDRREVYFDSQF